MYTYSPCKAENQWTGHGCTINNVCKAKQADQRFVSTIITIRNSSDTSAYPLFKTKRNKTKQAQI